MNLEDLKYINDLNDQIIKTEVRIKALEAQKAYLGVYRADRLVVMFKNSAASNFEIPIDDNKLISFVAYELEKERLLLKELELKFKKI